MNDIYQHKVLQEHQNTPPVLISSGIASPDVSFQDTKHSVVYRGGDTGDGARPYVGKHTVFVLNVEGYPLTPMTPAKARKILKGGKAKKIWSKFNTFGIQLLYKTREEIPETTLGYDPGTKFEGISVVCGRENNLSVKLDLPEKGKIVKKLKERKFLRRNRRFRNCRRRKARFKNRSRKGFIAPYSRLKILNQFCSIYPIQNIAMEDVRFNHAKYKWGNNFSTIEVGKQKIINFFKDKNMHIFKYRGFETADLRKKYGYKKTSVKNADKFSAHCSDSLALAVEVNCGVHVPEGDLLIIDDTYRCVRRKLHDTQPSKGAIRKKYSQGNINSIKKGVIIGTKSNIGQLCGEDRGYFRYYDTNNKRRTVKRLSWINNQFKRKGRVFAVASRVLNG